MDSREPCISLEKVNKSFGAKRILKDLDIAVPYGEIYGILGPSGCGKTTTVKVMAGILVADSGSATALGEAMPSLAAMGKIGYMAQSDALYSALTGQENMEFFGKLYGLSKHEMHARIQSALDLVDLREHAGKVVSAYSGGMKRRLSLAMAVFHQPVLLILDEPTVGIDPLLRQDIWEELYRLAKNGVTIIVTTHVMDEAEKCDRVALMREGVIIGQGTPEEIVAGNGYATMEEAFIGLSRKGEVATDEN